MRTIVLDSYQRHPQFAGAQHQNIGASDGTYVRRQVTAKCGCTWTGLIGVRGGGVSDGCISLCPDHAIPEDEGD